MFISEHRYIELFLNSTPAGRSDGGMSGGGAGFGGGGNMADNFDNMGGNMEGNMGMMGMNKAQMNMMAQAGDYCLIGPEIAKLNLSEHKVYPAYKSRNIQKYGFNSL